MGRRWVNYLLVDQRTSALTYDIVERTSAADREFESRVHHENAFEGKICQEPDKYSHWAPRIWVRELVTRRPAYPVWT